MAISPFIQLAYQHDRDQLSIPLDDGTIYHDADNHRRHMWTAGATFDRAIVKDGPRWALRAGRNFGESAAAKNASGLYLEGGLIFPLDHPVLLGRSFRRMIGLKPSANALASVKP